MGGDVDEMKFGGEGSGCEQTRIEYMAVDLHGSARRCGARPTDGEIRAVGHSWAAKKNLRYRRRGRAAARGGVEAAALTRREYARHDGRCARARRSRAEARHWTRSSAPPMPWARFVSRRADWPRLPSGAHCRQQRAQALAAPQRHRAAAAAVCRPAFALRVTLPHPTPLLCVCSLYVAVAHFFHGRYR